MAHYAPPAQYAAHDPAAAAAAAQQPPAYAGYGAPAYGAPAAAPYAAYPAQSYPAYGAPPAYTNPDELRTIFLTGFPQDVRERELNNLLRFLPGYEASQLHMAGVKSAQAQGFALFDCGANAQNALRSITNLVFEEGAVLRCEMARKNMYIKDDAATKRSRYNENQYSGSYGGYSGGGGGYGGAAASPAQPHGAYSGVNTKDNPPCNTLFIGNLGDGTDEAELRSIFGSQPGFRQIKLNRGARGITCFVEYDDVVNAMAVHQSQQGAVLQSSDRGAVRIQYSRNPFGKKRDFNHYSGDSGAAAAGGGGGRSPAPFTPQAAAPHQPAQEAPQGAGFEQPPAAAAQFDPATQAAQQQPPQQPQGEAQQGITEAHPDGMTAAPEVQTEGQPEGDQAAFRNDAGGGCSYGAPS